MQPYFFPYMGYFQLIHAVDKFVSYDDVAYRRRGWIHRNRLMVGGVPLLFSVPIQKASSSATIDETCVDLDQLPRWQKKWLRTLHQSYAGSKTKLDVLPMVEEALEAAPDGVASMAQKSVQLCCSYLGIETELLIASRDYPATGLRGIDRTLDVCRAAGAAHYVNAPGGRHLYDSERFSSAGIALSFLQPRLEPYDQGGTPFVPGLSILDVLLRQSRTEARMAVERYGLN